MVEMMNDRSAIPMDLSVQKGNDICKTWDTHSPIITFPYYYNNHNFCGRSRPVHIITPTEYPELFIPHSLNLQKNTSVQMGLNQATLTIAPVTQLIKTETPVRSEVTTTHHFQNKIVKEEKKTEKRGNGKRRLSESSSKSSESCNSGDSNNNNRNKVPKTNGANTCIMSQIHVSSNNSEKDEPRSPETELVTSEMRLERPLSSSSSESDICDSKNMPKITRPFKAITSGTIMDNFCIDIPLGDFETFRENILSQVHSTNKTTNQNMRRTSNSANAHVADPTYWEKRKRNNEAAKRSRDARRRKEDEIAIRCAYLERERVYLVHENKILKKIVEEFKLQNKIQFYS